MTEQQSNNLSTASDIISNLANAAANIIQGVQNRGNNQGNGYNPNYGSGEEKSNGNNMLIYALIGIVGLVLIFKH